MSTRTVFLLCDLQTKFRSAIYQYNHVVQTTNKMLKIAKVHNSSVASLGPIDPDVDLPSLGNLHRQTLDKTLFSMSTPEVQQILRDLHTTAVVLMVTYLYTPNSIRNFQVYVVADAVSSCNSFEIPIAFDAMRHAGVQVLTSESIGFLLMRDASLPAFKELARIVKESKESTKAAGEAL
ncbi:isochorismatase domain-containing protein [Lentinula raphanica]|nr:isochorismatase domain-containing protein [Lentinula raphanica]